MSRVLIIDDSDFDRRMIRKSIEAMASGREIAFTELPGGIGATDVMERERPDLTVLDIRMPGMDGFEVLSQIRDRTAIRDMTVIMVSGSNEQRDRALASQNGADDYYVKPARAAEYFELGSNIVRSYLG